MMPDHHREIVTPEEACLECRAPILFQNDSLALSRMEVQN